MSGVCYPDSLIGSIPNLYYYAANNPSEATIAKRRSYANTISYLTPPAENAGLYKGLKELKELISSYQSMRDSGRAEQITATIIETARQCNLDKDVNLPADDAAMAALSLDERDGLLLTTSYETMDSLERFSFAGPNVRLRTSTVQGLSNTASFCVETRLVLGTEATGPGTAATGSGADTARTTLSPLGW